VHQKSGASDQWSLIQQKDYAFYTRSTAYKKSEAPDRRSLIQKKSMIFTHVAPRIKRKGHMISGPLLSKDLYFLHV
jgi:hypothetical protein